MKKKWLAIVPILFVLALTLLVQNRAEGESGYAGAETCKMCHSDKYEGLLKTSHGTAQDPRSPAAGNACETCHGPGASHADQGGGRGVGGIISLGLSSPLSAEEKSATCLQCHSKGKTALWVGSTHEGRNLSCTNCHSVHGGNPKNLAKPSQPEVCAQCHKQIKAQLLKTSHHPIREGKLKCSDCHNPHGTLTEKLIAANSINEKCYECHAEKRGPFIWEHAPVTENCTTCHTPHGSSHDKLLVAKRPYLCQSCHSNSRHPGTLYSLNPTTAGDSVYTALNNRVFNRSCQNCHSQIHGSNHPSGKSLAR